jgi:CPA2 family monovalent cation:H+ antiporter-2
MTELALLLLAAAAGYGLAQWGRLPLLPLLLLAGAGLARAGAALTPETTRQVLELGLAFLVFAAGVELNPRRFTAQLRAVVPVALLQFLVVGGLAWFVLTRLSVPPLAAVYLAAAAASSSTLGALRELRRQRKSFEPFGRLVTGVLLVQDFLMVGVIMVLAALAADGLAMGAGLLRATLLLAGAWAAQRWIIPRWLTRRKFDEETLLLVVLALLFATVGVASQLGLPLVVGAFLAGFMLSPFPTSGLVRGQLSSLAEFFQAVLFVTLGEALVWPTPAAALAVVALVLTVLVVTPPLVAWVAERTGLSARGAIESGLLLAQTSEFGIVAGLVGLTSGDLTREWFSVLLLATAISMALTPFIATERVTRALLHWHPARRRRPPAAEPPAGHILMLGFGAAGMWVVKALRAQGHEVLVVDDDPAIIAQLERAGIPCRRGDGSEEHTLQRAGAAQARVILAGMRRVSEAEQVLRLVRGVPTIVRVAEAEDAERIRRLGGIAVINAHAAADTFCEWFDKLIHKRPATGPAAGA